MRRGCAVDRRASERGLLGCVRSSVLRAVSTGTGSAPSPGARRLSAAGTVRAESGATVCEWAVRGKAASSSATSTAPTVRFRRSVCATLLNGHRQVARAPEGGEAERLLSARNDWKDVHTAITKLSLPSGTILAYIFMAVPGQLCQRPPARWCRTRSGEVWGIADIQPPDGDEKR